MVSIAKKKNFPLKKKQLCDHQVVLIAKKKIFPSDK